MTDTSIPSLLLEPDTDFTDDGWLLGPVLVEYLKGLNDVPSTRKTGVYSPSSLSKCARALWYNRMGYEQRSVLEPKTRFNFDIGHAVHQLLNRYVLAAMPGVARVEVDAKLDAYGIHGELDLELFYEGEATPRRIVDFKTIKSTKFADLKQPIISASGSISPVSMRDYVWQLHAYMAARNCKLGTLFYVNKDTAEWFEARIVFSHAVWNQVEAQILQVEEAIADDVAPPRIKNTFFCPSCAFWYTCKQ
jgi:CRISPR/Cas system-associated exonuclease Cas4 (RecB family)